MAREPAEEDSTLFGKLKQFYYKLEDRYYAFLDKLYEGGVNLYKYFVDPIESRGIPSFPVAILAMLALLGGIWFFALSPVLQPTGTLTVTLSAESNESLANIPVMLLFDSREFAVKNTSTSGVVTFEGVPLNKRGAIRVSPPDSTPITVDLLLEDKQGSKSISLSGRRFNVQLQDFVVTVREADSSAPVAGAVVSYEALGKGVNGQVTTLPDGTAVIKLDSLDAILTINIEAELFQRAERVVRATEGRLEVEMTRVASGDGGETRGSVVVIAMDNVGNPLPVRVTLMQVDSSLALAEDNVESGVARFEQVAIAGTRVYAAVEALQGEFVSGNTPVGVVSIEEDLELRVELQEAAAGNSRRVSLAVEGNGIPLRGARVELYTLANTRLESGATGDNGVVSFVLDSGIEPGNFYASVNADGFLPFAQVVLDDSVTFELVGLAAGNNVEFQVDVATADGKGASGAVVELMDESGLFLGVGSKAGPSGVASFAQMPAGKPLRAKASLETAVGFSDVFSVPFSESGEFRVPVSLSRPVGKIVVTVRDLINGEVVPNAFISARGDSVAGVEVANCTTDGSGQCQLEKVWAKRDIYIVGDAPGFEEATLEKQMVLPRQSKFIDVFLLNSAFKNQTVITFLGLRDDKGNDVAQVQALQRGRFYTARFAASFAQGSTRQGIYLRVGGSGVADNSPAVIKSFEFSPSPAGAPHAVHSISFNPTGECTSDLLNSDVNNQGKKWVEVDYEGVSGVVELSARVFVKPTAQPTEKVDLNYRAFAVQNGKYARNPFDEDIKLERKAQGKDECYAETGRVSFDVIEGNSVCNAAGTACIGVSFTSLENPQPSSPFVGVLNRDFNLNFEIRNFGAVEAQSTRARVTSIAKLVKFSDYFGDGTASFSPESTLAGTRVSLAGESSSVDVLFGESKELYTGSLTAKGIVPADYAAFRVEFNDARGVIAVNERGFAVVRGTGTLVVSQVSPVEFEVGKNRDLRLTVRSATGEPVTDATVSFEEETGSPFDGDVPAQVAGDNSPGNGEDGRYVIRRVRPTSAGTFNAVVSRDRYRPAVQPLVAKVSNFFEFDNPDFLSVSCNATTLRVRNSLDVEVTADVYVDPACVKLSAPGLVEVSAQGGAGGQAHYRLASFRSGSSRVITVSPASSESCQVEFVAKDSRTGSRSLDAPIQVENSCTSFGQTGSGGFEDADGIVYINGNVFQPPRLLVDTFSYMRYGNYNPQMYDPRAGDPSSYLSAPMGGYDAYYQRLGLVDPVSGSPYQQFVDPRYAGMAGIPPGAGLQSSAVYGGRFGVAGAPDPYGGGSFFDIRRASFQRSWKIAWVNEDPLPHAFICKDRAGNTVVQVDSLAPGAAYVANITKAGLYYCKMENANKGTVKIKSMCPKKGAVYYTRLMTRCMARKVVGDSGLFDGGQQHSAKIAASVKTKFISANRFTLTQDSDTPGVDCSAVAGGASCKLKITPLVPRNGFAFAIEDRTGNPDYSARIKESNVPDHCFAAHSLETSSTYRALLQPAISAISTIGLTSSPQFASFVVKFNENGKCVKLRPRDGGSGKVNFIPVVWDDRVDKFIEGNAYLVYELQSNANPATRYSVRIEFEPDGLIDGRYLFTTIPTTVADNKLFYRTDTSEDPREPGFIINNLGETVYLLRDQDNARDPKLAVHSNSIAVLGGNEQSPDGGLNALGRLKDGFYLCAESGGCTATSGQAQKIQPLVAVQRIEGSGTSSSAETLAKALGDVVGNYKFETLPGGTALAEDDKPFICSGTSYCTALTELNAVELAQKKVEEKLKDQYKYVETINIDSSLDNTQDALATCFQQVFSEILAQEAQYQMCKTLADFCSGSDYLDYEEEEVEEGESFAAGLTLDSVVGDSQAIVKDVICQETQAGQNLQALRDCLQPGNRACRDRIASRIAGNLRQTSIQSVVREEPVVEVQRPEISFVTKRIQDNPELAGASLNDGVSTGGFNVYKFSVNPDKLVGVNAEARQQGAVLFEVRPAGYDLSRLVAAASTGAAQTAFTPVRLPGAIYDWITSTAENPDGAKLRQLIQGFPYISFNSQQGKTVVQFDSFQPTLLTLNKYPVMRAVDSAAREATTTSNVAGVSCSTQGRPVDPLGLFDPCAEHRTGTNDPYDAAVTGLAKAPFSRSLVYLVVPGSGAADGSRPVWPDSTGAPPFEVAVYPLHEFRLAGVTQRGESQSLLSRLLYPFRSGNEVDIRRLTIPRSDIKRYAVQVTSCAYARSPSDQMLVIDPSVQGNCAPVQWPVSLLLPGSTATNAIVSINNRQVSCAAGQACVLASMQGNSLRVATVAGQVGGTSISTIQGSVTLKQLAQELMRYYVDESYVPLSLHSALANGCTLSSDKNSVLLACTAVQGLAVPASGNAPPVQVPPATQQQPAQGVPVASNPLLVAFLLAKPFAPPATAVSQQLANPQIAALQNLAGVQATVQGFSRAATPTSPQPLSQAALASMPQGSLLVTLSNGQNTLGIVGYTNTGNAQAPVFTLTAQGGNLMLSPVGSATLSNVQVSTITRGQVQVQQQPFNLGGLDEAVEVVFETGTRGQEGHVVHALQVAPFAYTFVFTSPDSLVQTAETLRSSLATASGAQAAGFASQLDAYTNAQAIVDCTPAVASPPFQRKVFSLSIDAGTRSVQTRQAFPFELGSCTATLNVNQPGSQPVSLRSTATPSASRVEFNFGTASQQAQPASQPPAPQPAGQAIAQQGGVYYFDFDVSNRFQTAAARFAVSGGTSTCQQMQFANYVKPFRVSCSGAAGTYAFYGFTTNDHNLIECDGIAVKPAQPLVHSNWLPSVPATCEASVDAPLNSVNRDEQFKVSVQVSPGQGTQSNPIRFNFQNVRPS